MPPVRIELTTFRLWDWRAAYCAKEACTTMAGVVSLNEKCTLIIPGRETFFFFIQLSNSAGNWMWQFTGLTENRIQWHFTFFLAFFFFSWTYVFHCMFLVFCQVDQFCWNLSGIETALKTTHRSSVTSLCTEVKHGRQEDKKRSIMILSLDELTKKRPSLERWEGGENVQLCIRCRGESNSFNNAAHTLMRNSMYIWIWYWLIEFCFLSLKIVFFLTFRLAASSEGKELLLVLSPQVRSLLLFLSFLLVRKTPCYVMHKCVIFSIV